MKPTWCTVCYAGRNFIPSCIADSQLQSAVQNNKYQASHITFVPPDDGPREVRNM